MLNKTTKCLVGSGLGTSHPTPDTKKGVTMRYNSDELEKKAAFITAKQMVAAARTAPKACGVDAIHTLILDGEDKDKLTETMREIGDTTDRGFFNRDASNVDDAHYIVLVGVETIPRGLNCNLCGMIECQSANKAHIPCALAINDLGIACGSAVSVAMDNRIDNRILFSAGTAAIQLNLFPEKVKICFGIPLAISGKNIFFDRERS